MKYITTGIDIGTHTTRLCVIEHDSKDKKSEVVGFTKIPMQGMHHGHIHNAELVQKTLEKLLKETNKLFETKIDSAVVSFGSTSLSSSTITASNIIAKADNEVTTLDIEALEKSLEESAEVSNYKILHQNSIEYKIDGKTIVGQPIGMKGIKLENKKIFIKGLSQQVDDLESVLYEAGIEATHIVPKNISASEIILSDKQKVVGAGLLDIGAETTTLIVYEGGVLIGYLLIPIGSNDITNDIALGMKISLEEAEDVKHGTSTKIYPRKKIEDIMNARIDDISELVNNYLKKIKRQELLPGGIVLTGGGCDLPQIETELRSTLKLPIKKALFDVQTQKRGVMRNIEFLECYSLALLSDTLEKNSSKNKGGGMLEKIKKNTNSFFKQFLP